MFRIDGGTECPLELHDCMLAASMDMFSMSAVPESADCFPWLQFGSDWVPAAMAPLWLGRNNGVDDATFCLFDQLLIGEFSWLSTRLSMDWTHSLFVHCISFDVGFSGSIFLCTKFEPWIFSFCTIPSLEDGNFDGSCTWVGCCFGNFSSELSFSRRRAITFLISFKRSRSAASVTIKENQI